ncbi:unnamed protein product [Oncorhynchus mykiss]|uniref:FOXO protein transactivation domain-containing protein n=1 Tax=Oncorhynchus mykiss TaxID=8022 RepID=A0A061A6J4_ONCMY|nr:unnamed protein product [Oncorhynchus mykiss]
MINPEGGKGGKAPRRRAVSMDNSNKYTKSARGRAAKKKAALQAVVAGEGGGDSPSGLSKWPGSPTSRSSEELDAWTDFRSRTNSNASTLSGRLSPILANPELDELLDDEPPLSPMLYSSPGEALSPGNTPTPNGKGLPTELPRLADLAGTMNLNEGLTDDLMDELLDNIAPTQLDQPPREDPPGSALAPSLPDWAPPPQPPLPLLHPPLMVQAAVATVTPSLVPSQWAPPCGRPHADHPGEQADVLLLHLPLRSQTLQDLLSSEGHSHSNVMMTQSDPLMSQASAAAVISQNSRRGFVLRSDPMMTFGTTALGQGANSLANAKQQLLHSPLGLGSNGSSMMQIDSSLFLNGSVGGSGGICSLGPDRFPTDLDLDMFNGSLECDMESIIRNELMDADGLDFNFDSLTNLNGPNLGSFTSTKQGPQSWVPG